MKTEFMKKDVKHHAGLLGKGKILRKGVQEPGVGHMCTGVGHAAPRISTKESTKARPLRRYSKHRLRENI
jgi:hypothetical protein